MLNDLLRIDNLGDWKISFHRPAKHGLPSSDAVREFRANPDSLLAHHLYHRGDKRIDYPPGTKVICLTQMAPRGNRYLLTNVVSVLPFEHPLSPGEHGRYLSEPIEHFAPLCGRVVIDSSYVKQQGRVWAAKFLMECHVYQVYPPNWEFDDDFPGYRGVDLSWADLNAIVHAEAPSWRTALRNQKGIYLVTDNSDGKQYVGSAYGNEELWGRWSQYASTVHGNNAGLVEVLELHGIDHGKENFRFALLETLDSHTPDPEVILRESHWKNILGTRKHGHNNN